MMRPRCSFPRYNGSLGYIDSCDYGIPGFDVTSCDESRYTSSLFCSEELIKVIIFDVPYSLKAGVTTMFSQPRCNGYAQSASRATRDHVQLGALRRLFRFR